MEREGLFELAERNMQEAAKIVAESRIIEAWESVGATVNMVGSAKSGLLIARDVDFHVYTDEPILDKSFAAMMEFGKNPQVREIQYRNSLETEEECVEWHVLYENSEGKTWKMDVIHIRKGSAYDGVIEKTTDAVIKKLTPETKEAVLSIKYDMPSDNKAMGIEVYYAVFELGIRNYARFAEWRDSNPSVNYLDWTP